MVVLGVLALAGGGFAWWFGRAWNELPESERPVNTSTAVGMLFIPFYNVWWLIRILPTYVGGLTRASGAKGVTPAVNSAALPMALVAGFGSVLPILGPLLLGGFLLIMERARARLASA